MTKTISQDLTSKALTLCIEQVTKYADIYSKAITEFKLRHFEDRSRVPYFTHHMITVVNNCLQFIELAQQMKELYWLPNASGEIARKFETLLDNYQRIRNDAAAILLEESFLDLELHFHDLLTPKWLSSPIPVETICVTLEDYFQVKLQIIFFYPIYLIFNSLKKKFSFFSRTTITCDRRISIM